MTEHYFQLTESINFEEKITKKDIWLTMKQLKKRYEEQDFIVETKSFVLPGSLPKASSPQ